MEENQIYEPIVSNQEPEAISDNSNLETEKELNTQNSEGQSDDPELILGKFKSVEDLSKAYQELEKFQGNQSAELGNLRGNAAMINSIMQSWGQQDSVMRAKKELMEASQKYSTYFADPSFREIYKTAFLALGENLDVDRLVNLVEGYVSSRLFAQERSQAQQAETQKAIEELSFDKNQNAAPKKIHDKRINDMTPKELDELLEQMI